MLVLDKVINIFTKNVFSVSLIIVLIINNKYLINFVNIDNNLIK